MASLRVVLCGAHVKRDVMRSVLSAAGAELVDDEVREHESRAWGLLRDPSQSVLQAVAHALGDDIIVVLVDMLAGGRGAELTASRGRLVRDGSIRTERELSKDARSLLHDWRPGDEEGGYDEEDAVVSLAWELAEHTFEPSAAVESTDFDDRWAAALLDGLVGTREIELSPSSSLVALKARLVAPIGHALSSEDELSDAAAEVLERLMDCRLVDEVFIDDERLAARITGCRPSGQAHRAN